MADTWRQITCQERENLYWHGFDALPKPIASSTDPERYIYTEWGHPETEEPVLRDHLWPDGSHPCKHEIPATPDTGSTREDPTFNPAYQVARCGQLSTHAPHVVEHGPDQPRNCPGVPAITDTGSTT